MGGAFPLFNQLLHASNDALQRIGGSLRHEPVLVDLDGCVQRVVGRIVLVLHDLGVCVLPRVRIRQEQDTLEMLDAELDDLVQEFWRLYSIPVA